MFLELARVIFLVSVFLGLFKVSVIVRIILKGDKMRKNLKILEFRSVNLLNYGIDLLFFWFYFFCFCWYFYLGVCILGLF